MLVVESYPLAVALCVVTMLCWSTLPVALKITLVRLDAVTVTWFRFAVALLIGGALVLMTGRHRQLFALNRQGWWLLVLAALMLIANYVLYLFGLDHVTPGNAQVTLQLAPILMALGGILIFGERYSALQWAAFCTLIAGLGLFFRDQIVSLVSELPIYLTGIGLLVVSSLVWVVYSMAQKQLLRDVGSQTILAFIYLAATLLLAPAAKPGTLAGLDAGTWMALVFCALNTLVAYGALAEAMNHWEASRVSVVLALIPLGTFASTNLAAGLWPNWIAREEIGMMGWVGALLVVGASIIISLAGGRKPQPGHDTGDDVGPRSA